jgi:hypothetical protein
LSFSHLGSGFDHFIASEDGGFDTLAAWKFDRYEVRGAAAQCMEELGGARDGLAKV